MHFELEQSDESLTTHSGLALIGLLLQKTSLRRRLNCTLFENSDNPEISHADVAVSYLGILTQGKSDFDHIEPFRDDPFFKKALQCQKVPSSPTLRQRLDRAPKEEWETILREESASMLKNVDVTLTPAIRDLIPLDGDVSPFDNSGTKKEGVGVTYKKVLGYAPMFFYLGQEGYLVDLELRRGEAHCQSGTATLLERAIGYARRITTNPLLLRLDAGNDSIDNIRVCHETEDVEYIIKRNLRKESLDGWLTTAKTLVEAKELRPGKKVWTGSLTVERGLDRPLRIVFRVTERSLSPKGQALLVPDIEVETYWTSLTDDPDTVIDLYKEHGTMEQFHSEIKGELDLERLPSGKMATNSLVLHFGMFAYNLLRLIGQESLTAEPQPLRKKVRRRRIRTVIQNMITLASRMVFHARKWKLSFGKYSPWYHVYYHVYFAFSP